MAEEPNSDTFSLEDLDKILEEEDPGFSESLEQIKAESVEDTSSIDGLSVDSDEEGDADTSAEEEETELTPLQKLRKKLAVPAQRAKDFLHARVRTARNRLVLFKTQATEYIKHELPERWKWLKAQAKAWSKNTKAKAKELWAKPLSERLAYLGMGTCLVGALTFLAMTFKGHWLPQWEDPILESYESVGEKLGEYNSENNIPLFEAFPEVEFPVRIKEVKVNLRRDANSGGLPMGIFEFYLGVDSRDTAIELRDREKEIIDLVQRTLEGFTYHEVMSYQGKIRMKARIRDNVNKVLNQGQVNRVYINRMVTHH